MKILTLLCLLTASLVSGQTVSIPDAALKTKLTATNMGIDINDDGEIQLEEALSVTDTLYIGSGSITDLTGIEAFANITGLDVSSNQIETFNCQNTQLRYLDIKVNSLTQIDVSNCILLSFLNCNNNQLTQLNVTGNPMLSLLYCGSNNLSALDVTANPELRTLHCATNNLTALDVSQNSSLEHLYCFYNAITTLDLQSNPMLILLSCGYNPSLAALDFSNNTMLAHLNCRETPVEYLDLSMCNYLHLLVCMDCPELAHINLKNGINHMFDTFFFNLSGLDSLQMVCVDDEGSDFAAWVTEQVNPGVSVSESCMLGLPEAAADAVNIYPNPVSDKLYVTGGRPADICIYDFLGRQAGYYQGVTEADFSALGQGIYVLYIKQESGAVTVKKVVKQ